MSDSDIIHDRPTIALKAGTNFAAGAPSPKNLRKNLGRPTPPAPPILKANGSATATNRTARRTHGTGSIIDRGGVYYGQWRTGGRQVMRRLGPVRKPGANTGLTKRMAEDRLRTLRGEPADTIVERVTVTEAGRALVEHLEAMGRKPSTLRSYRSVLATQIEPRLGAQAISRVAPEDIDRFIAACLHDGLQPKTVSNTLGLLHSVFEYAARRGWTRENPCQRVDKPRPVESGDIRFLDDSEVEALLRAVPDSDFGRVQRALYLTAVMTGMRQGELLALRWMDVDWAAQRIRVRRNYIRGEFGTPKAKRGSRAVPLADRLAGELDRHYQRTPFKADSDLVFANPHTGRPLNGHTLLRSYQRALERAGVRKVRFHDLRHTFGTRMAAAGVPMRVLQEWMGHRDFKTTLVYADYQPGTGEADLVNRAFGGQLVENGGKTVANPASDTMPDTSEALQ
ncbi:MAG: tyrosine-type recombinase/integrase [Solirubrobacteraceae bacterium]